MEEKQLCRSWKKRFKGWRDGQGVVYWFAFKFFLAVTRLPWIIEVLTDKNLCRHISSCMLSSSFSFLIVFLPSGTLVSPSNHGLKPLWWIFEVPKCIFCETSQKVSLFTFVLYPKMGDLHTHCYLLFQGRGKILHRQNWSSWICKSQPDV